MESTIVSAPGKVLITGGYLVLEPENAGLVCAVSARFYTAITTVPLSVGANSHALSLEVSSPQFDETRYYEWREGQLSRSAAGAGENPYIEITLVYALMLAAAAGRLEGRWGTGLRVEMVGDNDFYSQRSQVLARGLPLTGASLASLPAFLALNHGGELVKTGLGSSAALIASLAGAMCHHLGVLSLAEREPDRPAALRLVHNLAQAAHCAAQGKIGSGFDISSAVYGTQEYRRFSPGVLAALLDEPRLSPRPALLFETLGAAPDAGAALRPLAGAAAAWGGHVRQWSLPPQMVLILADIAVGSKTPGMVATILAWRKAATPDATRIWRELAAANDAVAEQLLLLAALAAAQPAEYAAALATAALETAGDWAGAPGCALRRGLCELRRCFEAVRALLRAMGASAGVPVEPAEQTALIDAGLALPGVVFGGVPGAGGFDALFFVVLGASARAAVEASWARNPESGMTPMLLDADAKVGLCVEAVPPTGLSLPPARSHL